MKIMHYVDADNVSFRIPWIDLMKELSRRGIEQALLCRKGGDLSLLATESGVQTRFFQSFISCFPPASLHYPGKVRSIAPDLVHTRLSNAANIAGFWGKRLNIPTVAMIDLNCKIKYFRRADRYMSCSRWVKDYMVAQGMDPSLVDVVYNSVDTERYHRGSSALEARSKFREAHGIGSDDKVFIGAGRLDPVKGFDVLLRAFALLAREEPRARLLLAGEGPSRDRYAAMIGELGIADRTVLSDGFVTDIRPWLWGADFFVMPSFNEPFGIITLEAMASGLPVIVTDRGGPPEFITDGREGFVVPTRDEAATADAMRRMMLTDDAGLAQMLANAQERLTFFTSAALADRQIAIYERVLEEHRHKQGVKQTKYSP